MKKDEPVGAAPLAYPLASPLTLLTVLKFAEGLGTGRDEILSAVGLSPEALFHPDALLDSGRVTDAVEICARLTQQPDFGLRAGSQIDLNRMGAIGMVALHAPTAAEGLRDICRYIHLTNEATAVGVERHSSGYVVRFTIGQFGQFPPVQHLEMLVSGIVTICRRLLGHEWKPLKIQLSHTQVAKLSSYNQALGGQPVFKSSDTLLHATVENFERPLPTVNVHAQNLSQKMLQEREQALATDLAAKVQAMLRSMIPQGYTGVGDVASALNLTERTLQRRLGEQDTSFKQVLLQTRKEIVQRKMQLQACSASELCVPLGFSEASAVNRFLRDHCKDILNSRNAPGRR